MKMFEYKMIDLDMCLNRFNRVSTDAKKKVYEEFAEYLNTLGADGWELVSTNDRFAFVKREIAS